MQRKTPQGQKEGGGRQAIMSPGNLPISLCSGIHPGKTTCIHIREGPGLVRCEKQNEMITQGRQRPRSTAPPKGVYVAPWHTPHEQGQPHSFLNVLLMKTMCCAYNNKLDTCFYRRCLLETLLLPMGRETLLQPLASSWSSS